MELVRSDIIQFILLFLVKQVCCQFSCSLRPDGVCKLCDCIPECFDLSDEINCMNNRSIHDVIHPQYYTMDSQTDMDSTCLTHEKFFPPPPLPPFPLCPDSNSPSSPTKLPSRPTSQTPRQTSSTEKQSSVVTKLTIESTDRNVTEHNEHTTWTQHMSSPTETSLKFSTAPPTRETSLKLSTAPPPRETSLKLSTAPPTRQTSLKLSTAPPTNETILNLSTAPPTSETILNLSTAPTTNETILNLSTAPPTSETSLKLSTAPPTSETSLKLSTALPTRQASLRLTTAPPPERSTITATPRSHCQRTARGDEFCQRRYRGYFGHPVDCERYIVCEWGEYYECQCPPLTRWDMRIVSCIWRYMAPCLSLNSEKSTDNPANIIAS